MRERSFPKRILFSLIVVFLVFGSALAFDADEFQNLLFCERDLIFRLNQLGVMEPVLCSFAHYPDAGIVVPKQIICYIARQEKSPPSSFQQAV